jgi:hypothetical protein
MADEHPNIKYMNSNGVYNGKWHNIPRDAIKDWCKGAIKYNFDAKRYGVAALMIVLTPIFVPYTALGMTLDKLLLSEDEPTEITVKR